MQLRIEKSPWTIRVSLSAGMWAGSHSISRSMSGWSSVWAALYWRTQRLIWRS